MTNFPPPNYDAAVGAHLGTDVAPGSAPAPAPKRSGKRTLGVLGAVALFVVPAVIGYQVGTNNGSSSSANPALPSSFLPTAPSQTDSGSTGGSSSSSNGSTNTGTVDVTSIADELDDSVVNFVTTLSSGGQAAGSGIIISSSGLVITNNHVIADSTSISAEIGATGKTYTGEVLGYDIAEDVALVQLKNASGLKAVDVANSSTLEVGETIIAIGNAGGRGGEPTVVSGQVTALNQEITASESDGSNAQTLSDLIQVNANIQAGDSGGPLIDGNGDVVGMNAAASSQNGSGFNIPGRTTGNQGYAIPIENALAIVDAIRSGKGGDGIHLGGNRALLGVSIQDDSSSVSRTPTRPGTTTTGRGAAVVGVESGSGADRAGITTGSTITAVAGKSVASAQALTNAMTAHAPGDSVDVTWTDSSGTSHTASVKLGSGPPA